VPFPKRHNKRAGKEHFNGAPRLSTARRWEIVKTIGVGWVKTFAYVWKYASQFFLFSLKMRYLHCCRLMASTQWSIQACLLVF
jgi:hypothetical protein